MFIPPVPDCVTLPLEPCQVDSAEYSMSTAMSVALLSNLDDELNSFPSAPKTMQGFEYSASNLSLQSSLRSHQLLDWNHEAGISNQQYRRAKAQVFVWF